MFSLDENKHLKEYGEFISFYIHYDDSSFLKPLTSESDRAGPAVALA